MLTPDSLFYLTQAKAKPSQLKNAPARFDTSSLVTSQQWAKSKDGTKIPYFVVGPEKLTALILAPPFFMLTEVLKSLCDHGIMRQSVKAG